MSETQQSVAPVGNALIAAAVPGPETLSPNISERVRGGQPIGPRLTAERAIGKVGYIGRSSGSLKT